MTYTIHTIGEITIRYDMSELQPVDYCINIVKLVSINCQDTESIREFFLTFCNSFVIS